MARVAATKRNRDTSDVNRRAALFGSVGIGVAPPLIVWSGNEGRALEFATRWSSRAESSHDAIGATPLPHLPASPVQAGRDRVCFLRCAL